VKLLLLALLLLLGGCAELLERPAPVDSEQAWQVYQRQAEDLESWFLRGRLAIRDDREGWTANLHWRQQPEEFVMRLLAPLGQGTVELRGDHDFVSLLTTDNQLLTAPDPETLMLDNLGWSVPLDGLVYWVRGLPQPGIKVDKLDLDAAGRLANLHQSGWLITIDDYMSANGRSLPRRLEMANEHFHLRLVVQTWEALNE
jgi:outer membrane lipoprotein LolB